MSRKRRQRSTTIRKRVEKKQREEAKARKRMLKSKKGELGGEMQFAVSRAAAEAALDSLNDLERRLNQGPIRGWTTHDLNNEWGHVWLANLIDEALGDTSNPLTVIIPEVAKGPLSDQLGTLEVAAIGLDVAWDKGLHEVAQAVASATLIVEETDEDEEEGD
jgi:hypothetical protein